MRKSIGGTAVDKLKKVGIRISFNGLIQAGGTALLGLYHYH